MKTANKVLKYVFAFGFAILWIFPVIWLIISSFKDGSELFNYPLTILPEHFTLENYTTALQQFDLIRYTSNTAFITVAATVITVLMSCMCGYALAKYKYKWLNVLFMCLLATTMLPTEVIMSPSFTVLNTLGLYNSLWGCIIPTVGTMTMESARIDGANEGSIFVRIMLPICKPQIAILAIFSFQWRWNDYIWPLLALSDPKKYTLQLALRTLSGAEAVNWTVLLSTAVLSMIPILIVFIIFNKQIMNANMSSGVKG